MYRILVSFWKSCQITHNVEIILDRGGCWSLPGTAVYLQGLSLQANVETLAVKIHINFSSYKKDV